MSQHYQVWRVIKIGDFEVTTTNSNNEIFPNPITEYEKEDFQKMEMNALAINLFHCGLGPNEHNRIMGCKSAKQIRNLLEVTNEGTSEVKRFKIVLLMSKYERFEIEPRESIQERFTNITNELISLGRLIPTDEQVRKILRSLPQDERWRAKVTAIQESKYFTKFNLEELAGSLMTHELHLGTADNSQKKGLGLTAADQEESECDEEEASMLVRRFKKFFRNSRYTNQRNNKERRSTNTKSNLECHKCGSTDHFIKDCPMWKNEKARDTGRLPNKTDFRKPMIAASGESKSDAETENPEEEETANLCLMDSHESKNEKSKGKEVKSFNSFPNHLFKLNRYKLVELLIETQDKL